MLLLAAVIDPVGGEPEVLESELVGRLTHLGLVLHVRDVVGHLVLVDLVDGLNPLDELRPHDLREVVEDARELLGAMEHLLHVLRAHLVLDVDGNGSDLATTHGDVLQGDVEQVLHDGSSLWIVVDEDEDDDIKIDSLISHR